MYGFLFTHFFLKGNYVVPGLGVGVTVGIGSRGRVASRPMHEGTNGVGGVGGGGSQKSRQMAMARFRGTGNDSMKRLKHALEQQSKKTKYKHVKPGKCPLCHWLISRTTGKCPYILYVTN